VVICGDSSGDKASGRSAAGDDAEGERKKVLILFAFALRI
jgi:hypothetical protein